MRRNLLRIEFRAEHARQREEHCTGPQAGKSLVLEAFTQQICTGCHWLPGKHLGTGNTTMNKYIINLLELKFKYILTLSNTL